MTYHKRICSRGSEIRGDVGDYDLFDNYERAENGHVMRNTYKTICAC